jgi:biopolymer transport protein ExbD
MRSRSRRRRRRRTEISQELELMPMLNVFISIIPLLLLSAAFVQLAVIPTSLPTATAAPVVAAADEPAVSLAIAIRPDAYVVEANGAALEAIPRTAGAAHGDASAVASRARLNDVLAAFVAQHPGHREVRLVAESTTRYEELIDVMDVARGAGLPEAAFADAPEGAR